MTLVIPITNHGDVLITADLARQIVALAAPPTPATPPADDQGEDDTVRAMWAATDPDDVAMGDVLNAIKAGKVPGVCCDNDPNALSRRLAADLAACRAELDRERESREGIIALLERERAAFRESEDKDARRALELAAVTAERDRLAEELRDESQLLRDWARESVKGGWSTHQVEPMQRRAAAISAALAELTKPEAGNGVAP